MNEISNIVKIEDYLKEPKKFIHLFEIATQPNPEIVWKVREGFDSTGTLLVGDLNLSEMETNQLEIHPFPEWVIKIYQPGRNPGKSYAIVPNWDEEKINELNSLDLNTRIARTHLYLKKILPEDIIAVEYRDGMCIKIPRNVPHYFISKIETNQDIPYLQVFEPKIDFIKDFLGYDSTIYFNLDFRLNIKRDQKHN